MAKKINYEFKKCDCLHPIESYSTRSCPDCGLQIGHRDLVCPYCGARVSCNACGRKIEDRKVSRIKA